MNEQDLKDALDEIANAKPVAGEDADLCTTYKSVRPAIEKVLPVLKIFAPQVAAVIETLVSLLDGLCP